MQMGSARPLDDTKQHFPRGNQSLEFTAVVVVAAAAVAAAVVVVAVAIGDDNCRRVALLALQKNRTPKLIFILSPFQRHQGLIYYQGDGGEVLGGEGMGCLCVTSF